VLEQPYNWILQVAILSTGIYVFLRFLRTTRGSGLLRGLLVAFLFGAIGLWGLSRYLQFEELNHIIEGFTPYVAVILVILFQPELRRAMARLGQHNRLAQMFKSGQKEMVTRVTNAAVSMASRRHGALIAFQRETPLDAWTNNAVHIDSEVSATLLESIFHPGGALHDGAVVIEGDRVVAAACLFPLTENIQLSKSTGTRHRAALGLTEETDAVTLTVSEETGQLSIARQGFFSRDIPPADLEQSLRDALGLPSGEEKPAPGSRLVRLGAAIRQVFMDDVFRKAGSLALASGMIYLAYQDIVIPKTLTMQVSEVRPGVLVRPAPFTLKIRLPESSFHLVSPPSGTSIELEVLGTQANHDRLGSPGGVLDVPLDVPEGAFDIAIDDITWSQGSSALEFKWAGKRAPRLQVERYTRLTFDLRPDHVAVDTTSLDPHFVAKSTGLEFGQTNITIEGPREAIRAIHEGSLPFQLEPIVIQATDRGPRRELLGLAATMIEAKISILGESQVRVLLPIEPAVVVLESIERDLAVVNLRVDSEFDERRWTIEQGGQKATFDLRSAGLFDSPTGTPAHTQTYQMILEYAKKHLKAYVDVSDLQEGGEIVPVRWEFPKNWLQELFPGREAEFAGSARLDVVLTSSPSVLLTKN
jgi:diadenylate cyclase